MHHNKITKALESKNPIESLREIVFRLNKEGLNKDEIYNIFLKHYTKLQEDKGNEYVDILGDVLDMICGWYVGKNIDLKNE